MKSVPLLCALAVASLVQVAAAQEPSMTVITPESFKWEDAPAAVPRGARLAVVKGDPSKEGLFILRFRLPANYTMGSRHVARVS